MTVDHTEKMRRVMGLWMKSQPTVTAYIASVVRDRHHVEDLVQEVAAAVSMQVDVYDPNRPFLPWALGIARIRILKYLRNRRRDRHVFDDGLLESLAQAHERQADEAANRKAALHDCLKRLPAGSKTILDNRYFNNVPVQEIARSLEKTEGAVSMLLMRIRQRLATCIKRRIAMGPGDEA